MERSVAIGATSGSLSAVVLRLLTDFLHSEVPVLDCPSCPALVTWIPEELDIPSCLVGLLIGLLLGPVLDIVYLLRGSWRVWIRSRLASVHQSPEQLYKLL